MTIMENATQGAVIRAPFSESLAQERTPRGPNLFLEATEAMLAAISTFALADMRSLAHRNLLSKEHAAEVLTLPMEGPRWRELAKKHEKLVKRDRSRDFIDLSELYFEPRNRQKSMVVHHVGDENANSECVHIIARDTLRETIVLVFRGSITLTDWYQDVKLMIDDVPNPLYGVKDQPEKVGIHLGFRNYLHGPANKLFKTVAKLVPGNSRKSPQDGNEEELSDEASPSPPEEAPTRIQIILEQLRELKAKYPSDRIYISGHSLGGALALIAALAVAVDPILSSMPEESPVGMTPVTCFAIGNPKPGNRAFSNAILHLESIKKLRCCCVHNTLDVVPMLPANVASRDVGFWHPGFSVLLYKKRFELGRSQASTPAIRLNSKTTCFGGCKCRGSKWTLPKGLSPVEAAKNMTKQRLNRHDYREYLDRMLVQEIQMDRVYLNDLYQDIWEESRVVEHGDD
jgi:hypothetical protein